MPKACLGNSPEPPARSGAEAGSAADIEGVEDVDDTERRRWKTLIVLRVSVISMVSRVSTVLEGMPADEMVGRDRENRSRFNKGGFFVVAQ